jgi:hypothetical protein
MARLNATPWLVAPTSTFAPACHLNSIDGFAVCQGILQKHRMFGLTQSSSHCSSTRWSPKVEARLGFFVGPQHKPSQTLSKR